MLRHETRLFIVLCLVAMLSACATPLRDFDEPEVELTGFRALPSSGMEARFLLQLRILNPNAVPLKINGIHYELLLREQRALSGVSADAVRIPAYGEGKLELEAAAGVLGSLALVRDLLANPPEQGLPYTLRAKLSVDGALRALRLERAGTLRLTP
jgi:LEA14-like dessication related protein